MKEYNVYFFGGFGLFCVIVAMNSFSLTRQALYISWPLKTVHTIIEMETIAFVPIAFLIVKEGQYFRALFDLQVIREGNFRNLPWIYENIGQVLFPIS